MSAGTEVKEEDEEKEEEEVVEGCEIMSGNRRARCPAEVFLLYLATPPCGKRVRKHTACGGDNGKWSHFGLGSDNSTEWTQSQTKSI